MPTTTTTSMRAFAVLLAVVAVLAGLLPPAVANAGTADEPELSDSCTLTDASHVSVSGFQFGVNRAAANPWTDVCSGWLDVAEDTLTVSLSMSAPVGERPTASGYRARWTAQDGCSHAVGMEDADPIADAVRDHVQIGKPAHAVFSVECPLDEEFCVVPIVSCVDHHTTLFAPDAVAVTEDGHVLTFTVDLADPALAEAAGSYAPGSVLSALKGETVLSLGRVLVYNDHTRTGADYVVPAPPR